VRRVRSTQAFGKASLAADYVTSYYDGRRNHSLFENVRTYCLFVGHARSGHSIIGALLDAHPNMVVADELNTLDYFLKRFSRDQIFSLVLNKSRKQFNKGRIKGGREGKIYSYLVPGQWQGSFARLDAIGASKAGGSTRKIAEHASIIHQFRQTISGTNLKLVQVVRNPFDNISTSIIRRGYDFADAIDRYFANCVTLAGLREQLDDNDLYTVRHEDVIHEPEYCLSQMCRFLGLEIPTDYLAACASILYESPSQSRHKVRWEPDFIDSVQNRIVEYDFLAGYTFES
jgi:hypothetical protein